MTAPVKETVSGAKTLEMVRVRVKLGTVQTGSVEKGPDNIVVRVANERFPKGSFVDLPAAEAKALIDRGIADLASDVLPETATPEKIVAVGSGKVFA